MKEFQKYLFGTAVNGLSVAKYAEGEKITLVVERSGYSVKGFDRRTFDTAEQYEKWVDELVSDEIAIYNPALAASTIIERLER